MYYLYIHAKLGLKFFRVLNPQNSVGWGQSFMVVTDIPVSPMFLILWSYLSSREEMLLRKTQ
jgi:hypothetical protein